MYFDRRCVALSFIFMTEKTIKAWITKNALRSAGIKVVDADVIGKNMIAYGRDEYAFEGDWHTTPEAALARAEEMRLAKIALLRKRIAKLGALDVRSLLP